MHGYLVGTMTAPAGFNPAGECGTGPCTTSSFVLAHFGPLASYSCVTGVPNDWKVSFKYEAEGHGLAYRKWLNQDKHPGVAGDENKGDIANT